MAWRSLIAMLFISGLTACKDKSSLTMDITPRALEIEGDPGDLVVFRINATSDIALEQFTIVRSGNALDTTYLDTLLNGKSFSFSWGFRIPETGQDNTLLVFRIVDEDGNVSTVQRLLIPVIQNTLVEYNNREMYSFPSPNFNAFDLTQMITVTFDSSSGTLPDLMEFNNDTAATPNDVSLRWYSPNGGRFVKTASLNFSNSTRSDINYYFNGSFNENTLTDSLSVGDIYAYRSKPGSANPFNCLIRIDQIDYTGTTPARYVFSVKK